MAFEQERQLDPSVSSAARDHERLLLFRHVLNRTTTDFPPPPEVLAVIVKWEAVTPETRIDSADGQDSDCLVSDAGPGA